MVIKNKLLLSPPTVQLFVDLPTLLHRSSSPSCSPAALMRKPPRSPCPLILSPSVSCSHLMLTRPPLTLKLMLTWRSIEDRALSICSQHPTSEQERLGQQMAASIPWSRESPTAVTHLLSSWCCYTVQVQSSLLECVLEQSFQPLTCYQDTETLLYVVSHTQLYRFSYKN